MTNSQPNTAKKMKKQNQPLQLKSIARLVTALTQVNSAFLIGDAIDQFITEQSRTSEPSTLRTLRSVLCKLETVTGNIPTTAVTSAHVSRVVLDPSLHDRSQQFHLIAIRNFLKWCRWHDYLPANQPTVADLLTVKVPVFVRQVLTPDELRQLLAAATDVEIVLGIAFYAFTGVRRLELEELTWESVTPGVTVHVNRNACDLAKKLKQRILIERGLTATAGLGSNKLLAKIASDFQKPDGFTLILESDKLTFLRPLCVGKIYGVGPVTKQTLNRAHIHTIGDLQDHHGDLQSLVGSFGAKLKQFSFGEDDRPLDLSDEIKSVSVENTFQSDAFDPATVHACLWDQSVRIFGKLKLRNLSARTVCITIRYSDFTALSRQSTFETAVDQEKDIFYRGCRLLIENKLLCRPVRMIGLNVAKLCESNVGQLQLF
jgi:nucleotidyltransferase/DNA polymerase involved in DNA repair